MLHWKISLNHWLVIKKKHFYLALEFINIDNEKNNKIIYWECFFLYNQNSIAFKKYLYFFLFEEILLCKNLQNSIYILTLQNGLRIHYKQNSVFIGMMSQKFKKFLCP